jgi:hypothetical protein
MPVQREMAVNDLHILRESLRELPQHGGKQAAVWSLKIAVFDENHFGAVWAKPPIRLADAREQ